LGVSLKAIAAHPLTEAKRRFSHRMSLIHARVEHLFRVIKRQLLRLDRPEQRRPRNHRIHLSQKMLPAGLLLLPVEGQRGERWSVSWQRSHLGV
jgi:hypothetical protein